MQFQSNETVKPSKTARAPTDQSSRHGVLEVVLFRKQRDDARQDGLTPQIAVLVLRHDARPHLHFLSDLTTQVQGQLNLTNGCSGRSKNLEDSFHDASSSDASFQVLDLASGLIYIE